MLPEPKGSMSELFLIEWYLKLCLWWTNVPQSQYDARNHPRQWSKWSDVWWSTNKSGAICVYIDAQIHPSCWASGSGVWLSTRQQLKQPAICIHARDVSVRQHWSRISSQEVKVTWPTRMSVQVIKSWRGQAIWAYRVSLRTTVVWIYHPRCHKEWVNLEACGNDRSPCVASTIVKSMKNEVA